MGWRFKYITDSTASNDVVEAVLDIFYDAMGQGVWTEEKVYRQFRSSNYFGFYESDNEENSAYFFATVPETCLNDYHVLWIDACSVRKKMQSKGIFKSAIDILQEIIPGKRIGYIGGRTQNPTIIKMYGKLSSHVFYPFDCYYDDTVIYYLIGNIRNEVGMPYEEKKLDFDIQTGILKKVYGEKLGDYDVGLTDEITKRYEDKLELYGFNRNNGDAVIILKKILP